VIKGVITDSVAHRRPAHKGKPGQKETRRGQSVDDARFRLRSQYLREPDGEATNKGAERMGRTFRHRQRPHFNLRTTTAIDD
jgi:hypothetical protein